MTRRPLDGARRVTGDTATHAEYNVGPATDYGANTGDTIRAPFTGWVTRWWSTTGGNSVAITNDNYKWTGQHLSAYSGAGSGIIKEGAAIGKAGSTGSMSTGPHLHNWIEKVNGGGRQSVEDWLKNAGWKNTARAGGTVPGPYQTSTAGGGTTPIPEPTPETEMNMAQIQYYERTDTGTKEWMIAGREIDGGYDVTTNANTARMWGRQYSGQGTIPIFVDRDTYIATQAFWKKENAAYKVEQIALIKAALAGISGGGTADNAPVLAAIAKVPTAAQNADATRAKFASSPLK